MKKVANTTTLNIRSVCSATEYDFYIMLTTADY
jgi:hypothetical protein